MASLRLPLYPAEKSVAPATFCVSGASGYVAGAIVQRLLAAGHTVHGTVRDPSKAQAVAHLTRLPAAAERLKLFKADLLQPGSFDEAVAGCKYVIHVASPYVVYVPPGKGRQLVVEPAVKGTENILGSVERTPSVARVVLTSSAAALYGDPEERGKGHVFTDADWCITPQEEYLAYFYSKRAAEERAWALAKSQARWSLATILPGGVYGPPLSQRADGESVALVASLLGGKFWPSAPPFALGVSDVDDVAAAHHLAAILPKVSGRYLVIADTVSFKQLGDLLRPRYGSAHWLPRNEALPKALLLLIGPLLGLSRDITQHTYKKAPRFDASRAPAELGITYTPPAKSLNDMADALVKLGIVKSKVV